MNIYYTNFYFTLHGLKRCRLLGSHFLSRPPSTTGTPDTWPKVRVWCVLELCVHAQKIRSNWACVWNLGMRYALPWLRCCVHAWALVPACIVYPNLTVIYYARKYALTNVQNVHKWLHESPLLSTVSPMAISVPPSLPLVKAWETWLERCRSVTALLKFKMQEYPACKTHTHTRTHTFLSATQDTLDIVQPRYPLAAGIHSSVVLFTTNLKS